MWTPVEQQVSIRSATVCLYTSPWKLPHWRYCTKIKVISLQLQQEPNLVIPSLLMWRIGLPELRRPSPKVASLYPSLPPLHSSFPPVSILPVCLDGSTSLSGCEGRLFSLQARSRQEIGPRGPEDVKLLTRPVNLGCPISSARSAHSNENTNEAWGWTFLRPFSHTNPWVLLGE